MEIGLLLGLLNQKGNMMAQNEDEDEPTIKGSANMLMGV